MANYRQGIMTAETGVPAKRKRIEVIDAGRGAAMLFVFLSHFSEFYFGYHGQTKLLETMFNITMIASPSFMLISGAMLGYLFRSNPGGYRRIREKYIDRGLFLLLVAHILIFIIMLPYLHYNGNNYRMLFITDTIGLSMIIGSYLLPKIRPAVRLAISAGIFLISWIIVLELSNGNRHLAFWMEPVTGNLKHQWFDVFPFLPWFALFFAGTVIGEKISVNYHENALLKIERMLLRMSIVVLGVFVLLQGIKHMLRTQGWEVNSGYTGALLFHGQKNPPGLSYLLFYGGMGLFILYCLSYMIRKSILPEFIGILKLIGRNSLFVFVIQYFFLISLNVILHPCWTPFWPVLFGIEVLVVILLTWFWDARGFNRFLTVLHPGVWKEIIPVRKGL